MIKVNFVNEFHFNFNAKKVLKRVAAKVAHVEKVKGKHYVSVIVTTNDEIQKINKEYRKIDAPTDVISFALGDNEDTLPEELGDIFISFDKVLDQSDQYGHSNKREFAFLACHGLHHLLGYDHMNPEDEKIMFDKQEKILNLLKIGRK